ncbi:Nitrogen regulation protein NR(I) [Rosistilla carotiformis]|uniref:DNA-binding transcriptional regulator NtrC n=1 Tax=Rosistilla carotiformis TaxID=2528017 RepID=A0A518JXL4_9BACT|nr:sigma-54 dependent transcriptional regulator [Rosistilla carotiformis]QDV70279.1 Nitrogen regulation protein NR(I) [Rosistilla carotiformis]
MQNETETPLNTSTLVADPAAVVLVVDDEPSICWAFEKMLSQQGHQVLTASSAEEGLSLAEKHSPALVLLDVRLPKEDGISALPKFLAATNNAAVIVMTAFGDLDTAVSAIRNGASDYLIKPFRLADAQRTCRQALRSALDRRSQPATPHPMPSGQQVLVGQSPAMQQAFRQIALVAASDLSVLITGETGTGKELVAAAIHRNSQRADKPYIPISPVALNPDLIESELFGHAKGAFTGATDDRAGLFEQAQGGTILLDEIGDLPLAAQVKLLRVLEQGEYSRVGDLRVRHANVRIIAATNCDLHQSVQQGTFREDLYYRLTGVRIHLPPLRGRPEDIPLLCQHFLSAMDYPGLDAAIDANLIAELQSRPWSGNVRELKNAVQHAAVVARGRALEASDFPPATPARGEALAPSSATLTDSVAAWATQTLATNTQPLTDLHARFLAASEPALLRIAMEYTAGNRAKAAEILGIHRGTLRDRLRAYQMDASNGD